MKVFLLIKEEETSDGPRCDEVVAVCETSEAAELLIPESCSDSYRIEEWEVGAAGSGEIVFEITPGESIQ